MKLINRKNLLKKILIEKKNWYTEYPYKENKKYM